MSYFARKIGDSPLPEKPVLKPVLGALHPIKLDLSGKVEFYRKCNLAVGIT